jgi:hypothetical protein
VSPPELSAIISLLGVIVSIMMSVFVAGARYGRMDQTMTDINARLARIEGMFTLKLKQDGGDTK